MENIRYSEDLCQLDECYEPIPKIDDADCEIEINFDDELYFFRRGDIRWGLKRGGWPMF